MSLVEFPSDQIIYWENQAKEGSKAKNFKASDAWAWFDDRVLKALEDQAVETLKLAMNDGERLKAQQMFLAAQKPRQILDALISQGDGAKASLLEISTQEGDKDGLA